MGNEKMPAKKIRYGKPVKLLVDYQGFPDGRTVQFEIWRRKGRKEEKVSEVYGVTKGGKAYVMWNPDFEESTVGLKEGWVGEEAEEEKYYFVARIEDQEVKSADLEFAFPLDIYLVDENKNPLHDVDYTITFSDGSKRQGKFEHGHAKLEDAPQGKFKLEVEGYTIESGD